MEQMSSRECDSDKARQWIRCFLISPQIHRCIQRTPPLTLILSKMQHTNIFQSAILSASPAPPSFQMGSYSIWITGYNLVYVSRVFRALLILLFILPAS
jgi:hypothetical protein